MRPALVFDGANWFIRSIRVIEHDLERDEKVYRCDRHLGGPYDHLVKAFAALLTFYVLRQNELGRWMIVCAVEQTQAFSGTVWVEIGGDVHICNFDAVEDAVKYATEAGLKRAPGDTAPVLEGHA
jgi:hypothetical protein